MQIGTRLTRIDATHDSQDTPSKARSTFYWEEIANASVQNDQSLTNHHACDFWSHFMKLTLIVLQFDGF
jgi:hypothetical protein